MTRVLWDCDNTMGLPGKDVDDGLTLIYLQGHPDIKLEGITTVFGNGTQEEAFQVTTKMLKNFNWNVPCFPGASNKQERETPAARFIAEKLLSTRGEDIVLLCTGPLSNLKGAYYLNENIFHNLKEIVIMGGLTDPLIFNDQEIAELNLASDPEAALLVLNLPVPITVISGNLCLELFFSDQDLQELKKEKTPTNNYIYEQIKDWFEYSSKLVGKPGFYMWDLVAALYLSYSDYFSKDYVKLLSSHKELAEGHLRYQRISGTVNPLEEGVINLPRRIAEISYLKEEIYQSWQKSWLGG